MSTYDADSDGPAEAGPRRTSRDLDRLRSRVAGQGIPPEDPTDAPNGPVPPPRMRDEARLRRLMDSAPAAPKDGHDARTGAVATPSPATWRQTSYAANSDDNERGLPLSKRLALPLTILAGMIVALIAYAGGSDVLAIFGFGERMNTPDQYGDQSGGIVADSALGDSLAEITRAIRKEKLNGDSASRAVAAPKKDSTVAVNPARSDSTAPSSQKPLAKSEAANTTASERPPIVTPPSPDAPSRPPESVLPAATSPAVAKADERPHAPARRYSVQVGATSDRSEADRLARSLRSRRVGEVSITEVTKDGSTMYRVRYGAFASEADARASAGKNGLGEYWIVGR